MSSSEKKIGLIPKIVVASRMGPSEYALLITDKRSIFILEKSSKAGLAGAVGGVIGAAIAQAAATRKTFDYANESIDNLAINPKNIVVPHDSLQSFRLRKKAFLNPVFRMQIEYQYENGKSKKLKTLLSPPSEHLKQRKQEGVGRKQIHYDYMSKVLEAYKQALSPPRYETVIGSE